MKKRIINVIIIAITLFACITGIKAATILANSVTYGDMTVGEALDELIEQAHTLIDELQVQVNLNTTNIDSLTSIVNDITSSDSNVHYDKDSDMLQLYVDGEWIDWKIVGLQTPLALIPVMTSDTSASPVGSILYDHNVSSPHNDRYAYYIFDGNTSTYFYTINITGYFGFMFNSKHDIKQVGIVSGMGGAPTKATIQYTTDGNNWYTEGTHSLINENNYETKIDVNLTDVLGVRITGLDRYDGGQNMTSIFEFQLYGR